MVCEWCNHCREMGDSSLTEPPAVSHSMFVIRMFGPMAVYVGGIPLPRLRSRKTLDLLALLALRADRSVARNWLAGMLWPDSIESQALAYLRQNLSELRSALGECGASLAVLPGHALRLNTSGVDIDVCAFDREIKCGNREALQRAVDLYTSPLMEDCSDGWVYQERLIREKQYEEALDSLAAQYAVDGNRNGAIACLCRLAEANPMRESTHRNLMCAYSDCGDTAAAIAVYRDLRVMLHREINAEPSLETTVLFHSLRAEERANRPPSQPAPRLSNIQAAPGVSRQRRPLETAPLRSEPIGGAVPVDSAFYIERNVDGEFHQAINYRDSIVLVKGARQVGKTSLLARGLRQARESGSSVALLDLQALNRVHLSDVDSLCLALANTLYLELDIPAPPTKTWDSGLGASLNLDYYMRDQVLRNADRHLVWGLDEVDRLFQCPFGSEIFGLIRSWHNRRALDATGPWSKLTVAIAYATEAHLFISDLNQSPFNVGTRLVLQDFTLDEVRELNIRYGSPLRSDSELMQLYELVGGQPYLTRRILYEVVERGARIADLELGYSCSDGILGDHLIRMLQSLQQDTRLISEARSILRDGRSLTSESFYRLRSAGIVFGAPRGVAQIRCRLYKAYLERELN